MSCLLVCSQLCCCLRSALASNGCKCSQECRHLILSAIRHLYNAITFKQCHNTRRHWDTHYCVVQCFMEWRGCGSFEICPNIPQVALGQSRCVCGTDEGDSRLAGISSGYEWKPFCFTNFNSPLLTGLT